MAKPLPSQAEGWKRFSTLFSELAYRWDTSVVFEDFLTAMMNGFTVTNDKTYNAQCFQKYSPKERMLFGPLIAETILIFRSAITEKTGSWYDFFGEFYEDMTSRRKQAALGQFFTPPPIVDLMVLTQGTSETLTGKKLRVNDPACGSARMLISFHAHFPGNYVYGQDIDLVSCKMSCLNLMLHGCEGEIVHHNALDRNDYRNGWWINPYIHSFLKGIPHILPIPKEQSVCYQYTQQQHKELMEKKLETQSLLFDTSPFQMTARQGRDTAVHQKTVKEKPAPASQSQLSLF